MTWGRRWWAAALAVLVLLVGCSSSRAQDPEPSPPASSQDHTASLGRAPDGTVEEPSRWEVPG
jgi:hypothetical protein